MYNLPSANCWNCEWNQGSGRTHHEGHSSESACTGLRRHLSGGRKRQRVLCVSRGEGRPEGRAFQIGYSGHECPSLRLGTSLRPPTSGLSSNAPQPPPSRRCRLRRQRLPAPPDWRCPRARRKPLPLRVATDGVLVPRSALRALSALRLK